VSGILDASVTTTAEQVPTIVASHRSSGVGPSGRVLMCRKSAALQYGTLVPSVGDDTTSTFGPTMIGVIRIGGTPQNFAYLGSEYPYDARQP